MSNDEEMIIRGRLMTDYAEAKRRKTILQTERDRVGTLLTSLGSSLKGDSFIMFCDPSPDQLAALDGAVIKSLVAETLENDVILKDLRKKLKDLGLLDE